MNASISEAGITLYRNTFHIPDYFSRRSIKSGLITLRRFAPVEPRSLPPVAKETAVARFPPSYKIFETPYKRGSKKRAYCCESKQGSFFEGGRVFVSYNFHNNILFWSGAYRITPITLLRHIPDYFSYHLQSGAIFAPRSVPDCTGVV